MHAHAAQNYARHTRLRAREIAAAIRKARNAACVERSAVARLSPRAHTRRNERRREKRNEDTRETGGFTGGREIKSKGEL